jgi:Restriction endonuclease
MAEAALVTQEDLADGASLVQELDAQGFPVSAAFWAFDHILEAWRLIIAAPPKAIESLIGAYNLVQDIVSDNNLALTLDRVSLIPDDDPKVENLRAMSRNETQDVVEASIGHTQISGRTLSGIHLYRQDALRYERAVFSALQRVQPSQVILRDGSRLGFSEQFEVDFLADDGRTVVVIECKSYKRLLDRDRVLLAEDLRRRVHSYFQRRTGLLLVSQSGFTDPASEQALKYPHLRIVRWQDADDDSELQGALNQLL